jgi:pyruvate/2-oxoglutarate dehydrogenase complex dihydrolipoamide acyltransferase (E2) component
MTEHVSVAIPKPSMSITEATFIEWLVEDGATVAEGELIYSVATDKVEVEVEAPAAGVLRHGTAEAEETYPVGTVIGAIEPVA